MIKEEARPGIVRLRETLRRCFYAVDGEMEIAELNSTEKWYIAKIICEYYETVKSPSNNSKKSADGLRQFYFRGERESFFKEEDEIREAVRSLKKRQEEQAERERVREEDSKGDERSVSCFPCNSSREDS